MEFKLGCQPFKLGDFRSHMTTLELQAIMEAEFQLIPNIRSVPPNADQHWRFAPLRIED